MGGHFGTDMQQGTWLMLLGCALYTLVLIPIVARDTTRVDKWLELLASLIFCVGCWYFVEASYPQSMMELMARLSAPPPKVDDRTLFERYVTSSKMMFSTQLFNVGMLPYLVEGAYNMKYPPADDPPGAAMQLFVGVLVGMPLLLLFSLQATEESMRANGGLGTSYVWDSAVAPAVRALNANNDFWKRHLGSDNLFVLWLFFVLMVLSCVPLVPLWLMDPGDEQKLCGVSMSCGAALVVTLPFTLGSGLMVRATYPEGQQSESLLGQSLRATGQWLIDGARSLEPAALLGDGLANTQLAA